jgi:hypothetical protein
MDKPLIDVNRRLKRESVNIELFDKPSRPKYVIWCVGHEDTSKANSFCNKKHCCWSD